MNKIKSFKVNRKWEYGLYGVVLAMYCGWTVSQAMWWVIAIFGLALWGIWQYFKLLSNLFQVINSSNLSHLVFTKIIKELENEKDGTSQEEGCLKKEGSENERPDGRWYD